MLACNAYIFINGFLEGILSSKLKIEQHFDDQFLQDIYKWTTQKDSYLLAYIYRMTPKSLSADEDKIFTFEFMSRLMKNVIKTSSRVVDTKNMNKQLFIFSILRLDKKMSDFFWRRCGMYIFYSKLYNSEIRRETTKMPPNLKCLMQYF